MVAVGIVGSDKIVAAVIVGDAGVGTVGGKGKFVVVLMHGAVNLIFALGEHDAGYSPVDSLAGC